MGLESCILPVPCSWDADSAFLRFKGNSNKIKRVLISVKRLMAQAVTLLESKKAEGAKVSFGGTLSALLQLAFVAVVFIISTAYLVDATYNPFLYFRF